MLRSVLLQVRQILPVQFRHHSKRGRVTVTYLTFVETCKLMAMALLDFFSGFFDMIVAGRRDYVILTRMKDGDKDYKSMLPCYYVEV